jgi:hypothetical protein
MGEGIDPVNVFPSRALGQHKQNKKIFVSLASEAKR